MTPTSPSGPPPHLREPHLGQPHRTPVVVPVAPADGWARADLPRRIAAVSALPLAVVLSVLALQDLSGATVQLLWLAVGPMTFYSLARVLRPEDRHPERTPRHLLASAATSFAVPVLAVLVLADGGGDYGGTDIVVGLGSLAFVLGVTTVVWGVIAVAVRWFTSPPAAPERH